MKDDALSIYLRASSLTVRGLKAERASTTDVLKHASLQSELSRRSSRLRAATLAAACRNGTPYGETKQNKGRSKDPDATLIAGFLEMAHTPAPGEEAKHKKLCLELAHSWKSGAPKAMPWWSRAKRRAYHLKHGIPFELSMFDIAGPAAGLSLSTMSNYR